MKEIRITVLVVGAILAAVVLTAASLYLALYGVGTLLIRTPDTGPLWSWIAIAAGAALAPQWWRRLRNP